MMHSSWAFSCWFVRLRNRTSSLCFFSSISLRSVSCLSMASHFAFSSLTCFSSSSFSSSSSAILGKSTDVSSFVGKQSIFSSDGTGALRGYLEQRLGRVKGTEEVLLKGLQMIHLGQYKSQAKATPKMDHGSRVFTLL